MKPTYSRARRGAVLWLTLVCSMAATVAAAEQPAGAVKPLPPWDTVKQATVDYFAGQSGYQPGDIISRGQVRPLLSRLAQLGFVAPDAADLLERVAPDDDYLVTTLRQGGQEFMRQVTGYPGGYDRLDRLSRLPHGKRTIEDLIRGPGGYKLIEYLTSTPGGIETGKLLSNAPKGAGFNQPTGRIYTVDALLGRLQMSYAAAIQLRAKTASPR